ncbi:hypothetical protein Cgig2_027904 [Carnegiea gigantea]|uniref:Legumain prodomain domain-containing protein n=1 Tax=Carnegiea gigantea TaxID=171969 RepID=A0A9Q1KLX4_9CARY|nr:hypothetical protein Cgig2_027904 [Carnegiea gigantea]
MAVPVSTLLVILLIPLIWLSAQLVQGRLTKEALATAFGSSSSTSNLDQGTKWAVLVAGSRGYGNYRHQADVCHAYQILKRGGLNDENIIVFMYDDIASNEENPKKGIIINSPKGEDVYKGVPKDYTGDNLTTNNLLAAILGNKTAVTGGSGKVVNSGPDDHIFIYYSDHGSPGVLTMPGYDDDLYAKDFINTLKTKHESGTYKSMVIYVEACEAGSIFEGLLPKEWNIYVTTASNPSESSWATYCPGFDPPPPPEYNTCLGDLYSVAWMEDSDAHNLESETLEQQYQVVKNRTAAAKERGSHAVEYGNMALSKDPLSLYMGANPSKIDQSMYQSPETLSTVEQHDADILHLREKVRRAPEGSNARAQAQKELDEALSHRKHIDLTIQGIGEALLGAQGYEELKVVRSPGQTIVDDWDCFKALVGSYKRYCGALSTYGKKHLRVFANMCNAGVQAHQLEEATSQVCGNKLKK